MKSHPIAISKPAHKKATLFMEYEFAFGLVKFFLIFATAMFVMYISSDSPRLSITHKVANGESSSLSATSPFLVGDKLSGEVSGRAFIGSEFSGSRFVFRNGSSYVELLQESNALRVEILSASGNLYTLGPLAKSTDNDGGNFSLILNEAGTEVVFKVGSNKKYLNVVDDKLEWNLQGIEWGPRSPDNYVELKWSKQEKQFLPFLWLVATSISTAVFILIFIELQRRNFSSKE